MLVYLNGKLDLVKFPFDRNPPPCRSLTCSLDFSSQDNEESIKRIREMFDKVKLSVSAYDTAWVAMVSSRKLPNKPRFPECLRWVMENQQHDGSWSSLQPRHGLLVKDSLLSTLACLLALRKWRVGEQLLLRGLEFIGSNGCAACDAHQISPLGFDILFPCMIKYARELELNLPLDATLLDRILQNHALEIERMQGNESSFAYFAEALGPICSWEKVRKLQRTNGSLQNSPAATAAALNQHYDYKFLAYLCSILKEHENWVPVIYPSNIYIRLQMVDEVQKLGLKRYFTREIHRVLDETYRLWNRRDEEILSDVTCCAMAFRYLRLGGYEVSQDELVGFVDEEHYFRTVSPQFTGVTTILELYRASHLIVFENEDILEKINAWTGTYLKRQLLNQSIFDNRLCKEVESTVKNYHGSLERVVSRECIELYNTDEFQVLKTAYRCFNKSNMDLLAFSVQDFNACQAIHQDELQKLEGWFEKNRLHLMNTPRRALYSGYFMITADVFEPELSATRISFAQTTVLIRAVDDLFDNCASRQELVNIIELVKKWDKNSTNDYCSKQVEIFFLALYNTIDELAEEAFVHQGRCVKKHLISMWQELLEGMMMELDWWRESTTLTMEEYLSVACSTIGSNLCILTGLYFIGPILSEEVMGSEEIRSLCKHVSMVARLLNDLQTLEKELLERKPNSVSLLVLNGRGGVSIEDARESIQRMVESSRRELLRMVLQTKGSMLPRKCKNLFWTTSKIPFYLYKFSNEYDSPKEILRDTKLVIFEPIEFPDVKNEVRDQCETRRKRDEHQN